MTFIRNMAILAGLTLGTSALAQSYSTYDYGSGNYYSGYRGTYGTSLYGRNSYTGTTWQGNYGRNGKSWGTDSRGNTWNYNSRTGAYWNSNGKTCYGKGQYRTCYR